MQKSEKYFRVAVHSLRLRLAAFRDVMKNNDDIPTTETTEIKQFINRVKQGECQRVCWVLAYCMVIRRR